MSEKKKYTSRFGASTIGSMASPDGGGLSVQFYSIGTGQRAEFAGFISDFTDSFSSNWNNQQIFGRMDPVMNIIGTTRNISLGFTVPAYDLPEARQNLAEINKLAQFLYPTYRTVGSHQTVKGNPLVKVQFQNLIASGKNTLQAGKSFDLDSSKNGLIVAITSLSYNPDFEQGVLGGGGMQYPKVWNVNMTMQVIHDHSLSPNVTKGLGFPYATATQEALNPKNGPEKKKAEQKVTPSEPVKVNGQEVPSSPNDQDSTPAQKTGGSAASVSTENKVGTPSNTALKGLSGNSSDPAVVTYGNIAAEVNSGEPAPTTLSTWKPKKKFPDETESGSGGSGNQTIKVTEDTVDQFGNKVNADYYEYIKQ